MSKYPLFKLHDLASEWCKGQPFKKTDIAEHGQTPCIHYGELFTKYGVVINQCLSKTDVQGKRLSVSGDILFPASDVTPSGLARCSALMQDNVILGGDIIIMRPRHGNDPRYLSYAINCQKEQILQRVTGALIKHLSGNSLKSVIIPVPPLVDQVNLVSKLEKISALITFRKLQLEKLDQLASSRFIEMFGDPVINPKGWKKYRFDSLCENLDSKRKPVTASERKAGIYPYYGASGIVDYVADYLFDENILLISEDGANLLIRSTPIAFSVTGKVWVNNHAHVVRFQKMSLQKYVEVFFSMIDIADQITGTAQPKLNQAKLNSMLLPVPEEKLLEKFLAFYEQLDKSKVIGEKQGIMLEKITCHDIL